MISRLQFVSYEYVCGEMCINPAYSIQHLPILCQFRSDYHRYFGDERNESKCIQEH